MWPIWVLLWKHLMIRKRSIILILVELFVPLLFIGMIVLAKPTNPRRHELESFSYEELKKHGGNVVFTPDTYLTNRLMDAVGARLGLRRLDHLPRTGERGYYAFSNETPFTMFMYSRNVMSSEDAIVIFENISSETWPKWPYQLNYTIRMKTDFDMNLPDSFAKDTDGSLNLFSVKDLSLEGQGSQYRGFMRLQWAIDTSFLSLITGTSIDQILSLQEFPRGKEKVDRDFTVLKFISFEFMAAAAILPLALFVIAMLRVARLYEEKNSGLHELQKMAGVRGEVISVAHALDSVPMLVAHAVTGAMYFKLAGLLPHTNGGHIFLGIMLYGLSILATAFVIIYIFNITAAHNAQLVTFGILIAFFFMGLFAIKTIDRPLAVLGLLIIQQPYRLFWLAIGRAEKSGRGTTWANMNQLNRWFPLTTVAESHGFTVLQILLLSMLSWYLSKVRPGQHGLALPWNFLFSKKYWSKDPPVPSGPRTPIFVKGEDKKYFERAPVGIPVGIQVINVYKSFKKDAVLYGVNLDVFRGEITVLLGHNGAGKTTLINIITGFLPATGGRVLVEGKDVFWKSGEVRKLIGLCPQHNIFFEKLSVVEHARFFAMLKAGQSCSESKETANRILDKLQLRNKASELPANLSGGMKRRLQLACALAGGARVLMLDEPTSGLDVETRRELWDLLLSLRGEHTVLLTTHFMEEADALGDRVVALYHGRVRCHATAMFLKRAIGTGYRLTFVTFGTPDEDAITRTITNVVPDATVRDRSPSGLSYNLPAKDTALFPKLFAALEDQRESLKIDTIGVGKSTLDEVFLELCSDDKPSDLEVSTPTIEPQLEKFTGRRLCVRQFTALLLRQWRFMNVIVYIVVIVALALLIVGINYSTNDDSREIPKASVDLSLDLYSAPAARALANVGDDALAALRRTFREVEFDEVPDIAKAALRAGREDADAYKKYFVGIELNDTSAKGSGFPTLGRMLNVRNQPLRGGYVPYDQDELEKVKSTSAMFTWAFWMTFIYCLFLAWRSGLPCAERESGTRHAYIMAGVPRALHWAVMLLVHAVQALPIIVIITACPSFIDKDDTLKQAGFLWFVFAALLLSLPSLLGVVYLLSTMFNHRITVSIYIVCSFVFGHLVGVTAIATTVSPMTILLNLMSVVLPPGALVAGLVKASKMAARNGYCNLNREKCPTLNGPPGFPARCCDSPPGSEPFSYYSTSEGAGWNIVILACQAVAYSSLTFESCGPRLSGSADKASAPLLQDPVVKAEADYVEKTIKLPSKLIPDAILGHNVNKVYYRCCGKPLTAVKNISFSVKKGECFGLLGVNGAGKTTTFKMLTGETASTGGEIFANGYRATERVDYMRTLSYCPQFGGVDDFLTGRQNLTLVLTLRGLQPADVKAVSDFWIKEIDLHQHADKVVSSYSGGTARKLAAVAALCQPVRATVLDEPTSGLDPLARRLMHQALMRARRHHSIIVASHSLDEIEALCHRIAIMAAGEIRALGSAPALKTQHAQGYSVVFKLVTTDDMADDNLNKFKEQLQERLICQIREQRRNMLRYHVKDPIRYSELFTHLENLREEFPALVEDYTVTETTLEEVFLALAKEAKQASGEARA